MQAKPSQADCWEWSCSLMLQLGCICICGRHVDRCCWSLFNIALILCSWADSLHSCHTILNEWLAFYSAFLNNIHQSCALTALFGCDIASVMWNCCRRSTFCIHHTTMHHVTSLHAKYWGVGGGGGGFSCCFCQDLNIWSFDQESGTLSLTT